MVRRRAGMCYQMRRQQLIPNSWSWWGLTWHILFGPTFPDIEPWKETGTRGERALTLVRLKLRLDLIWSISNAFPAFNPRRQWHWLVLVFPIFLTCCMFLVTQRQIFSLSLSLSWFNQKNRQHLRNDPWSKEREIAIPKKEKPDRRLCSHSSLPVHSSACLFWPFSNSAQTYKSDVHTQVQCRAHKSLLR